MTKLLKVTTIILATIILGAVVSGCVKKPVAPVPTVIPANTGIQNNTTTAEIDTTNWKTYRNEQYGFEFKYPGDLSVIDWANRTPNWKLLLYVGQDNNINDGAVSVGIEKDVKYFDREKVFWPIPRENIIIRDVVIGVGNYKAKEVVVRFYSVDGGTNTLNYFIEDSSGLVRITYNLDKNSVLREDIFRAILSSFTFIL